MVMWTNLIIVTITIVVALFAASTVLLCIASGKYEQDYQEEYKGEEYADLTDD